MRTELSAVAVVAILAACGGSPPPAASAAPTAGVVAMSVDAAMPDAAPADASIADQLAHTPAWIFRFHAADRFETWTLRYSDTIAALDVEAATGTTHYTGAVADDGVSLTLTLAAGSHRLGLTCKRSKLAVGAKCGARVKTKSDVLDCYHPDYKSPMSFGAAPGIEYASVNGCNGYRLVAPAP